MQENNNQAGWNFDPQTGKPVSAGQTPPAVVPQQAAEQAVAQPAPQQSTKNFCPQTGQALDGSPRVVDTGRDSGQDKCPACGATDISFNPESSKLRCNFCRTEFEPEKVSGFVADVSQLRGKVVGSGTKDISAAAESMITLKCQSCGAEVVIDTDESAQARCHWCRNTLSLNEQVPNGAIPDAVLPFAVQKEDARQNIEAFVAKRKFFAHPAFKKEFCTENVMGVYLPYMIVDVNAHAHLKGQGEVLVRKYTVGSGDSQRTVYDADLYDVERDYDIVMKGLTIESNTEKLQHGSGNRTNNIINAIMPFDTENCVAWNANYLKGYASEKRDANVDQLKGLVETKAKDVNRHQANTTLTAYNRGVKWAQEQFSIKGQQWKAAYLPVWLYSYQQVKSPSNKVLHYVAVNARSKETMGSVPIHQPKLLLFSLLASIIGTIMAAFLWPILEIEWVWVLIGSGFLYYAYYYNKYRNAGARHMHEFNTKAAMSNVKAGDSLVKRRTGLSNATMDGANNLQVNYGSGKKSMLDKLTSSIDS
ncbi:MAG: TFIIB-type zinc ribbon-containing protein [Coriobacteriia bacterium]|nr:TFIIB-type zinc ribbon-containing protein [Coriobacteriia bacterium]